MNESTHRWAHKHEACVNCGSTTKRHIGRGLCLDCYNKQANEKQRLPIALLKGEPTEILTRKYLREEYFNKCRSLGEIATSAHCSRSFVYQKLKEYRFPVRSKSSARNIALDKGKIRITKYINDGTPKIIVAQRIVVNTDFFKLWSNGMAYVLGLLFTDGYLMLRNKAIPGSGKRSNMARFSLAQKEPELLTKALKLMHCNARLTYTPRCIYNGVISGELYRFTVNSEEMCSDLQRLGLTPNKSLTLRFPEVPLEFTRHFIRGCWDGDGSIYMKSEGCSICASYVSGSYDFIVGLTKALENAGLDSIHIYTERKKYYAIKFVGQRCERFLKYIYSDVPEDQYLIRKHAVYAKHIEAKLVGREGQRSQEVR